MSVLPFVRRPARPSARQARIAFWIWAALLLGLVTFGLGRAPLFDVDEGAFSEATRELLASGDWGHTTLNGEDRFDKPILIYWLQAASVQLFGLHEAALRLPSALATWGWALGLALFAWPRWGLRAAVAAGSVLATTAGVMLIGRAATADALLNLWLTLAALDLWRALEAGTDSTARRAPLRRAAIWLALGMLTKGPVAWLIPGAAVAVWLIGTATTSNVPGSFIARLWQRLRPLLTDGLAWALLLGIALPWYAYALNRHGMAFVDGFFLKHNLQRYGGALEGHGGSWLYYVVLIPVLMFPWSALLVPVLARVKTLWADPLSRYLLGWAGFVLIFFSGSGTKLPHYALYGLTPLALLAGQALVRLRDERATAQPDRVARWSWALLALSLVLWPLLGLGVTEYMLHWIAQAPAGQVHPLYLALMSGPVDTQLLRIGAVVTAVLATLLCAPIAFKQPAGTRFTRPALAAALGLLFQATLLLPWWGDRLQGPVRDAALQARAAQAARTPGTTPAGCVQWGLHQPSFALYLQQPCPRRAPQSNELALVRSDQLPQLAAERAPNAATQPWQLLYSERGLSLIRWLGP